MYKLETTVRYDDDMSKGQGHTFKLLGWYFPTWQSLQWGWEVPPKKRYTSCTCQNEYKKQ